MTSPRVDDSRNLFAFGTSGSVLELREDVYDSLVTDVSGDEPIEECRNRLTGVEDIDRGEIIDEIHRPRDDLPSRDRGFNQLPV